MSLVPVESIVTSIIQAITVNRQTMSQENRDRFDALFIASLERGDKFWGLITGPLTRALENLENAK